MKKRFVALLMTLALAIGFTTSAFAAEPAKSETINLTSVSEEVDSVSASEDVSTRASLGDVIAAGSTTINGGSGVLYVNLSGWNLWADITAGIGYTSENGIVTCSVLTPDGDVISLGSVRGSGSMTTPREVAYASAGTYAFYFTSALSTPYEVVAYIYD